MARVTFLLETLSLVGRGDEEEKFMRFRSVRCISLPYPMFEYLVSEKILKHSGFDQQAEMFVYSLTRLHLDCTFDCLPELRAYNEFRY